MASESVSTLESTLEIEWVSTLESVLAVESVLMLESVLASVLALALESVLTLASESRLALGKVSQSEGESSRMPRRSELLRRDRIAVLYCRSRRRLRC